MLLSESDVTHFATFEVPHAMDGGLRAWKQKHPYLESLEITIRPLAIPR
jgi:hypothetical protein